MRQDLLSKLTSCCVKVTWLGCKHLFSKGMLAHLGTVQVTAFTDPPRVPSLVGQEFQTPGEHLGRSPTEVVACGAEG